MITREELVERMMTEVRTRHPGVDFKILQMGDLHHPPWIEVTVLAKRVADRRTFVVSHQSIEGLAKMIESALAEGMDTPKT